MHHRGGPHRSSGSWHRRSRAPAPRGGRGSERRVVLPALPEVFFERRKQRERHLAEFALVDLSSGSAVGLHVPRKLARLGARVRAHATLVRLFPSMRPPVDRQVTAVLEHLPAVLTRVVASPDGWRHARKVARGRAAVRGRRPGARAKDGAVLRLEGTWTVYAAVGAVKATGPRRRRQETGRFALLKHRSTVEIGRQKGRRGNPDFRIHQVALVEKGRRETRSRVGESQWDFAGFGSFYRGAIARRAVVTVRRIFGLDSRRL